MKRLPKQFKKEIIQMIENENLNPSEIARKLNLKRASVESMVRRLGYKFTLLQTPQFFKGKILQLLKEGKRPYQIAKELNLHPVSTSSFCWNLGIKFNPSQGNVRYFQTIDSYLKAYFLGFIAADGCIVNNTNNSYGLTITIHSKDRIILDKLKEEIGNKHKIQLIHTPMGFDKSRNVDHVRFNLYNKDLVSDLNSHGIHQRKSMTIGNIIQNIPEEFKNAFIIGYLDGDGCVTLPKNKKNTYQSIHASFRGTKDLLQGIANHLNLDNKNITFDKTYILNIGNKKDILKLFNCYKNLNFYLARKHDKFLERIKHESYKKLMQD